MAIDSLFYDCRTIADNGQGLEWSRMKILCRLESFVFSEGSLPPSPSLSRESKLIGSIFPIGIWWICLASFRAEFLWRHRFFGLFSIAFGLTSHRSKARFTKGNLFSPWNQTHRSGSKTHLRERHTHSCQCPFGFIWPSDDFACSKAEIKFKE